MQADYAVELGPDAPALEVPWASPSGDQRYFDLRGRPELLLELPEASQNTELARFLSSVNGTRSRLQSAKCDIWITDRLDEDEDVFAAEWKYGSYVDLFFCTEREQLDLSLHESTAKALARLLSKAPEVPAAAEIIVRRCYFHRTADLSQSENGYCFTVYLFGYGDDEAQARQRWVIGLDLMQNAIVQVTQRRKENVTGAD